ncbi:hypothetical protein IFM89_016707 [Coptis chinensis]|uniref:Uncharacterized protein n=1 Tax=Coptis chinensis TaxID=261450 RepID=A0A835IQT1_9MAGN|nr:hypothetical protein IFM89_016707 [Coptis chinensis]
MESVGILPEGQWNSFSGICAEESDFMTQLLGNCYFSSEQEGSTSTYWPSHESTINMVLGGNEGSYHCSGNTIHIPEETTYSDDSTFHFPSLNHVNYLNDPNLNLVNENSSAMDYCMVLEHNISSSTKVFPDNSEDVCKNEEISRGSLGESGRIPRDSLVLSNKKLQLKRKSEVPEPGATFEDSFNNMLSENSKMISWVQNNKKHKLRSCSKVEAETNGVSNGPSCSYSSEDDSNGSQEINGGATSSSKRSAALNLNGKARAGRGSATDPQSLYARVDISTMLEEAVEYVKFLQLQIKLLSSDDHWMYAPIAYNGMNLGLDLKISPPQ